MNPLTSGIEARYLPPNLQEMAQVIGLPATLMIVREYGGTRVWVPKTASPDHPLWRLIGPEALARLCQHYGGEFLDIAKGEIAIKAVRDAAIRAATGKTQAQLAREYHLTERHIRTLRGGIDPADATAQGGLF